MGFRDLKGSLAQYNLLPPDPEAEKLARMERIISESMRIAGLEDEGLSVSIGEQVEEWTVVYDKFKVPQR